MPGISLQEAADRLGVHYMTAYRYVRLGRLPATKEGNAWVVDESDVEDFGAASGVPRSSDDWVGDLERFLLDGDPTGAWGLVEDALVSSFTPEQVHLDLVLPVMRRVGDRWASGEIGVGDEHLASAVARRVVSRLSPRFTRRGAHRATAIVAMGPGEWHALGAEVLADLLRGRNIRVLYLGANTPPEAVALASTKVDDVVAICVAAFQDETPLAAVADAVAASGSSAPLILGGPAVGSEESARRLGGSEFGASIAEVVDRVDALAG